MRRSPRLLTALVAAIALVVTACGGGGTPEEQLSAAFEATFSDSFDWTFTIDADADGLAALGEGAQQMGLFLGGLELRGTSTPDGASLTVEVLGTDFLEMAFFPDDETVFFRAAIAQLIALTGQPLDVDGIVTSLDAFDLPPTVIGGIRSLVQDGWVAIEGELDTTALNEALGGGSTGDDVPVDEEAQERAAEIFGEDGQAFIENWVDVVATSERDGETTYEIGIRLRDLVRALQEFQSQVGAEGALPEDLEADLADLPETIPGTILIRGEDVLAISTDLAEIARQSGEDVAGSIDLLLEFGAHGRAGPVERPDGAAVVPADDLTTAIERAIAFLEAFGSAA